MKKLSLFFVLFMFCCLLTACGSDKNCKTIVKFATWGSKTEINILKPLLAEFEKENPEITVELMHVPQNYFQKIHLLFAAKLYPDVVFINNIYFPIYQKAGLLENMQPYFKKEIEQNIFFEKSLENFTINGMLYAIPRDVSNLVIFYNKDLFDKYKVAYPQKNWTMKDFLEIAKKLSIDTNNDGKNDVWGISYSEQMLFWLPYLLSNGGGIFDKNKNYILNSEQSLEALQFYADLANKYHVAPKKIDTSSKTASQMFIDGQLAMQLTGRWVVPKYREDIDFDWDIINFPNGEIGSVVANDASGWAIAKNSKNKTASVKLIKFLSSKYAIQKFAQSGLIVPARKDIAYSEYFLDTKQKPTNAKIFLEVAKTSQPTIVTENYKEIEDKLKTELELLFNGAKSSSQL